ncbi:hypothetical protein [Roseofilum casamattae]|uniref:Uncharacterized protein n=1 Tax=Roseofilum casamattae BLCC-M143 TaxID=3022442 RepID=A0ABT7BW89_9CYAN|nr:hypothetical protein [Roseofilum casamattae]MDJ1182779.1 hypothetical protein [Roseofilum casamattae BLCC-M143]
MKSSCDNCHAWHFNPREVLDSLRQPSNNPSDTVKLTWNGSVA